MDHQRALNRLRSREVLTSALNYAFFDRSHSDGFFDPFEIENARADSETLISDLVEELKEPGQYMPRPAFAYFPPKNALCDRRLIYLPIKDLTIRYAIAMIFSDQIESSVHPQCFANRRATGSDVSVRFTEDFSTGGWARFCKWQEERSADNTVLLRTDISSFYDSISHEYLVESVCQHLMLPPHSPIVSLFRRLLEVPVIYYSPRTGLIEGPTKTHQGLPIGDGVEGYLANLYLKDVDDAMVHANASYGRYVDDIRLFGNSRKDIIQHLRILQEQLLRKGLNLNASKTEIAEDPLARKEMMSRLYHDGGYEGEESEEAGSAVKAKVDLPLEQFDKVFTEGQPFNSPSDAKDFCKFLGLHTLAGQPIIPLAERQIWHIDRLRDVVLHWRGPTKHAAWLLAQTAVYRGVQGAVQSRAREVIIEILTDESVSHYSQYRLLHHLVRKRRAKDEGVFCFIDLLSARDKLRIQELAPKYLSAPAFELNLIALYLLRISGRSIAELRTIASQNWKPNCEPLRNALEAVEQMPATQMPAAVALDEPDAIPEHTS